jgi:nucleotide sugar dehydrogenase
MSESINPITGKKYTLPTVQSDQSSIDAFLALHPGKKVIVVQGLGFVGSVMSLVVANGLEQEYAVIGIDVPNVQSYWKIASINDGHFPVIADDPKIATYFENARKKKNLLATFDPYAYSKADVIIVDINLDVAKRSDEEGRLEGYSVDLTAFKKAIGSIASNCRQDAMVLVETTVPPGTTQKVVVPILQQGLTDRGLPLDQIRVGHSYERVMPGPKYVDSIQNFYRVYAGVDELSANAVETFLRTIIRTDEYPLTRLGNTNATEMAKVLENSFRAMNIAFMVEWSRYAELAGVDIYEVVNAIRLRPTHKNIMLPGLGVGGYCLTKDPLLASWSAQELFGLSHPLTQSEVGVGINDRMPHFAFDYLKSKLNGEAVPGPVCLLGVSYLNDVGDTRYTPVQPFYRRIKEDAGTVHLHDPHVRYWEEEGLKISSSLSEVLNQEFKTLVITTGHRDYRGNGDLMDQLLGKAPLIIYDTIGVLTNEEIRKLSSKHRVWVLGRGDL